MVDYTGDQAESGVVLGKHSNGAVRIQAPGIGQREYVVSGMRPNHHYTIAIRGNCTGDAEMLQNRTAVADKSGLLRWHAPAGMQCQVLAYAQPVISDGTAALP